MIKQLSLKNFKSFEQLDLQLGTFSVFVGANAAGKSNILQAFKFIHDISIHGLENAIAIQGGFKFLQNVHCQSAAEVKIEALVTSQQQFFLPLMKAKKQDFQGFTHCRASEIRHRIILVREESSFTIKEDSIICKFNIIEEKRTGTAGTITSSHKGEKISTDITLEKGPYKITPGLSQIWKSKSLPKKSALAFSAEPISSLSLPGAGGPAGDLNISYYDFDPRLSKQAVRISGSSDLEESADNLAVVIQKIVGNPLQKERLFERVRDLLPYVKGLDLEHFSDSSVLMNLKEQYVSDFAFPASLISNGTVSVIATLVAVLFQDSNIVIMEEPERNIHPYLIERLLNTIKEAATSSKQILISTHSPTVLDNCGLDNLFLVRRDSDGISRVSQPKDSSLVSSFLSEDFGVGNLYQEKLLEL